MNDERIFTKPTEPKNSWQLLSWLIFEPTIFQDYTNALNKKQILITFLHIHPCIILISCLLYSIMVLLTVTFDTPLHFPSQYHSDFANGYQSVINFEQKINFVIRETIVVFLIELIIGLSVGFIIGLILGFVWFSVGLSCLLAFGLSIGIAFVGFDAGMAPAFMFAFGIAGGFAFDILLGANFGIFFGFIVGIAGFRAELAVGLSFLLGFYISYLRLYFYPFYFIRSLFGMNFYNSPYHQDSAIWLPIWGVEKQFRLLALNQPEDAANFIGFLRQYRPLQTKLADSITYAAHAGFWLNNPLDFEELYQPYIENKKLQPSDKWLNQLEALRSQLVSYRQQNQLALKKQYLEQFLKQLDEFFNQTLVENKRWRDEYLQALALWQKVGLEELHNLELQTSTL